MRGHIGCVLKGKMEITFADHAETFAEGDGIFIPPGEPGKHRSKVLTDSVLLIVVEEV
jgi:quercetin dioxygenase-like cupin family protein